ncbi:MAG: hypothetical protein PUP93_25120 [Rhizonema sp. NSF051]|nr:hypothetical protein [Rhizonema sp. NSF051]
MLCCQCEKGRAIADATEVGDLPEILNGISSKSQLEILREISTSSWDEEDIKKFERSEGRYAHWKSVLKRANIQNWMQAQKAITALKELYSQPTEDPIKVQIRRLERELVGMKMHDFFPTPSVLCDLRFAAALRYRLVKLAKLKP